MADKQLERFHLDVFLKARGHALVGEPIPGESPDFLLPTADGMVGVEICRFHRPPAPGERSRVELDGLRKLLVRVAHRVFRDAGGPPLWVTMGFAHDDRMTKADAHRAGVRIAEALLRQHLPRSFGDGTLNLDWEDLPPTVTSCRVRAVESREGEAWYGDSATYIAPVEPHHVQAILDAKAPMLPEYRRKAPRVLLAVMHDIFREPQGAELGPEAESHAYSHGFDEAWWVEVHSNRALRLRGARPPRAA